MTTSVVFRVGYALLSSRNVTRFVRISDELRPDSEIQTRVSRSIPLPDLDPEALDLLVERAARDAEAPGGGLDAAALGAEHPLDVLTLDLDERAVEVVGRRGRLGRLEAQVAAFDDGRTGKKDRALEHVAQLADVSRPGVALQRLGGVV